MRYRSPIATAAIALLAIAGSVSAGAREEPLKWQRAAIQSPWAWHTSAHEVVFATTLELPNACYRAKVHRYAATGPRSALVYEVLQGEIAGAMCAQMIVDCTVLSEPAPTTKNYIVVKDRNGTRKVRITDARPKLPANCPE